jgi:hypothetical protein
MQLKETQKALNAFGKYVVQQSRTNLTKGKKNASKRLYDSIDYEVLDGAKAVSVVFRMEDYGKYQDLGVSGVKKKYNTPYSYTSKMPPAKAFSDWVVRKGLEGIRDDKGRFIKRKSLQYIIARSVYMKGIKPSLFFTKPFEKAFERLPKELQEKFGIDLQNAFD